MPTADNQGSFLNLISIRRNQVGMDNDQELEDLELFQKHVAIRFADLLSSTTTTTTTTAAAPESPTSAPDAYVPPPPPPFLSISWLRNLLDNFLCCEAEFKALLVSGRDPSQFSKPPLDRLIPDLLDRSIKALDIFNAVTHGVELIIHWQKLAEIAVAALEHNPLGEGQVRRARKALTTILNSMVFDDKENTGNSHGKTTERSWSLGRRGGANNKSRHGGQFRPLAWPAAKSWSAAKQIQAMSTNLVAPRGADVSGLAMPIYIMSTILVFSMWALVTAIPCQERNGLSAHLPIPKQLGWAQPISGLVEKIGDDWKKKEKKGNAGLMEEVQRMEKVAQSLVDFSDSFVFPMEEEAAAEVAAQVAEMKDICEKMEEGLRPLQHQVREVFHKMVRSRGEVLDIIEQIGKTSIPVPY